MRSRGLNKLYLVNYSLLIFLSSCSITKEISTQAETLLIRDSAISPGFIGISIYEPAVNKYWYNYNATKYFTPASNTKLFSLYAGLKYLGDSLPGIQYTTINDTVFVLPTGDPTLLHPDFTDQPVAGFLKNAHLPIIFSSANWKVEKFGPGWAWDDYNDDYMAERNALPVYGNLMTVNFKHADSKDTARLYQLDLLSPTAIFNEIRYHPDNTLSNTLIKRQPDNNNLDVFFSQRKTSFQKQIPFITNGISTALQILHAAYPMVNSAKSIWKGNLSAYKMIRSRPSDSLFRPMMHNSDNFFAEQTLLMVSNIRLGYMNQKDIIDTILANDLHDIPQLPKWVDGSGLSRYNLFSPQSFIYILNKMRNEFGWHRLSLILPAGGEGTLRSYYKNDSSFIHAKTGTLSNNCSLSGFLLTHKGKLLIFSILANHYQTGATPVRRAVERFLEEIRKKY